MTEEFKSLKHYHYGAAGLTKQQQQELERNLLLQQTKMEMESNKLNPRKLTPPSAKKARKCGAKSNIKIPSPTSPNSRPTGMEARDDNISNNFKELIATVRKEARRPPCIIDNYAGVEEKCKEFMKQIAPFQAHPIYIPPSVLTEGLYPTIYAPSLLPPFPSAYLSKLPPPQPEPHKICAKASPQHQFKEPSHSVPKNLPHSEQLPKSRPKTPTESKELPHSQLKNSPQSKEPPQSQAKFVPHFKEPPHSQLQNPGQSKGHPQSQPRLSPHSKVPPQFQLRNPSQSTESPRSRSQPKNSPQPIGPPQSHLRIPPQSKEPPQSQQRNPSQSPTQIFLYSKEPSQSPTQIFVYSEEPSQSQLKTPFQHKEPPQLQPRKTPQSQPRKPQPKRPSQLQPTIPSQSNSGEFLQSTETVTVYKEILKSSKRTVEVEEEIFNQIVGNTQIVSNDFPAIETNHKNGKKRRIICIKEGNDILIPCSTQNCNDFNCNGKTHDNHNHNRLQRQAKVQVQVTQKSPPSIQDMQVDEDDDDNSTVPIIESVCSLST